MFVFVNSCRLVLSTGTVVLEDSCSVKVESPELNAVLLMVLLLFRGTHKTEAVGGSESRYTLYL